MKKKFKSLSKLADILDMGPPTPNEILVERAFAYIAWNISTCMKQCLNDLKILRDNGKSTWQQKLISYLNRYIDVLNRPLFEGQNDMQKVNLLIEEACKWMRSYCECNVCFKTELA
jgi:hypothetical protein